MEVVCDSILDLTVCLAYKHCAEGVLRNNGHENISFELFVDASQNGKLAQILVLIETYLHYALSPNNKNFTNIIKWCTVRKCLLNRIEDKRLRSIGVVLLGRLYLVVLVSGEHDVQSAKQRSPWCAFPGLSAHNYSIVALWRNFDFSSGSVCE